VNEKPKIRFRCETRFKAADLRAKSIQDSISRHRKKMAKDLQALIDAGFLSVDMKLSKVMELLKGDTGT